MAIEDNSTKTFSKTGITGSAMAVCGSVDIMKDVVAPLISGQPAHVNWLSVVCIVGGLLTVLFRRYSDGKIPKVV